MHVTLAAAIGACGGRVDGHAEDLSTGGDLPDQGSCEAPGRFSVTGDIVVDGTTHLLWQRQSSALRMTYGEAETYCEGLVLSGVAHWRVPTIEELDGLVLRPSTIFGCGPRFCCPAIDPSAFPDTPSDLFWSSTIVGDGLLYGLNFGDGRRSNYRFSPDEAHYVRCTHAASP